MAYQFFGDINIEYGAVWYQLPDNGDYTQDYVECISITETSGCIDTIQAETLWLVEDGSVYMPWDKCAPALSAIGALLLPNGDIDCNGDIYRKGTQEHWLCYAQARHAYAGIEGSDKQWLSDDCDALSEEDIVILKGITLSKWMQQNFDI